MTDSERIEWLEKRQGQALISDDFGRWAVSTSGMQNVPEDPGTPSDIETLFFVEAAEWKGSIREAIDYAVAEEGNSGPTKTP